MTRPRKPFFFFFCEKGRKLLPQCWSLLRVNESQPQWKRGISTPISDKCVFGVHPAELDVANSFMEFQARCEIVPMFQERVSFPGSWKVPEKGPLHSWCDQHREPKPLCTLQLLPRRKLILPACTHPTFGAFSFMVLIWKPTSAIFWGLGSTPSVQSSSPKSSTRWTRTRKWTSSRTLDPGTWSLSCSPDYGPNHHIPQAEQSFASSLKHNWSHTIFDVMCLRLLGV